MEEREASMQIFCALLISLNLVTMTSNIWDLGANNTETSMEGTEGQGQKDKIWKSELKILQGNC